VSAPWSMPPEGLGRRGNRVAAWSRSPAHGTGATAPGGPAPAHPRHRPIPGTGPIPGTAVAVPVLVVASAVGFGAHRRSRAGKSERERTLGVCSSFYEGPAGADDPVAPGPTNTPNAGEKGLLCQRPCRWRPGGSRLRAARNRAAAWSRSPAHGTVPGTIPGPAGTIPGTGTAVAVPVLVAASVLVVVAASAVGFGAHRRAHRCLRPGGRRERGRRPAMLQMSVHRDRVIPAWFTCVFVVNRLLTTEIPTLEPMLRDRL